MAMLLAWLGAAWLMVGGRFDVAVGGRAEIRGGQAPVDPLEPSEPSIAVVLIPVLGAEYMAPRAEARLAYRPRLFWRFPNLLDLRRPLHLHSVDLTHGFDLTRRTRWFSTSQLMIGELDYTAASLVFGGGQSAIPNQAVVPYVDVGGEQSVETRVAPRHAVRVDVGAAYSGPLEDPGEDDLGFARTLRGWTTPRYAFAASRVDDLEAAARFEWLTFLPDRHLLSALPSLQWERDHTRVVSTTLRGGVMVVMLDDFAIIPAALASVRAFLVRRRNHAVAVRTSAAIEPFVDVVQGVLEPRASLGAGVDATLARDWLITVDGSFSTPATRESRATMDEVLDETLLMIRTPVRYRASSKVALEFGTWITARGPHLSRGGLDADRLEIWGYVAVSGAWALRGDGVDWAP